MNVSVVIPAKNEEESIGACLDRLAPQLRAGDEIIVLDNGSTDDTAGICENYARVRTIDAPDERFDDTHYRGLSQLRQFGANTAANPIVATTDADTLPPTEWIEHIRSAFESDDDLSVMWGVAADTNGVPVRDLTGKYLTLLGGVSGCNTAFRKSDFEDLKKGYTGWPMFEDVALITRLARTGKAVHDRGMVMQTDLDRRRYQTIPMLATGGAGVIAGGLVGGPVGALAAGCGAGIGGTELFYEDVARLENEVLPDTPVHHDQVGLGLTLAGVTVGGPLGLAAAGLGTGIVGHHVLTEGASAIPTDLMLNTDEVCEIEPQEGGDGGLVVRCEPVDDTESKVTRVLAAATAGAVAGRGLSLLSARI